jgi:oligopeptidase A
MFKTYNNDLLKTAVEDLKNILETNTKKLDELLSLDQYTFDSFLKPFQELSEDINNFFTPISQVHYVNNSEETQEVYTQCLPLLTEYYTDLSQNKDVADAVQSIFDTEKETLSIARYTLLDNMIKDFKLGGVTLPDDKKAQLKAINLRLSELGNTFAQNLINATNAYELEVTDPKDVEGIPESDLASLKTDNGWTFTLHMPSYIAYMTYGPNKEIREKIYKAYCTRAPENGKLIEEILSLRDESAKLLGFGSYRDVSLETKSAPNPEEVISFLESLAKSSKPQGEEEYKKLIEFASSSDSEVDVYDLTFYAEKLKETTCDFDENIYRPYFEKTSVVNGMFDFTEKIFGLTFEEVDIPLWDAKAKAYDLYRQDKLIARLYTDLEARKGKRDGAWMSNWQSGYVDVNGNKKLPSAIISCNFPKSTDDAPSLLRHRNVVTLFHETGHALHHMCSEVEEAGVSGVNGVQWDTIEFPSQFLESFAYEHEVLDMFASHYQTGEKLSKEMVDKLRLTKDFNSAMGMLRQLEFGLFDLNIHDKPHTENEVQEILDSVRQKTAVVIPPDYNKFQNGFAHIFAGGYAAGYYSYKWAERLSADAFYKFVDNGIFNKETGNRFYESVLTKGGSEDPIKLFKDFMGREPGVEALLRLNGIKL